MNNLEILDKWAKYTDYDPEQKSFNLLNYTYELHDINKRIERIIKIYDKTGGLAVIQAKIMFKRILKKASYNAFEYMKNPNMVNEDKEIWDIFHCKEVISIENSYIDAINKLSEEIIGKYLIGERNNEEILEDLFEAIDTVMESLEKCNVNLFIKNGQILPINKISTHIHLFETLAECLIALETTNDGLYLCYINCGGTADGYFGFFLKNNGNLLSISERIDEAYSGQHSHCRNARWAENKKYDLFPYDYIFNYTEHDYKGCATKHLIDNEKLAFFELGAKAYLPIIVAMLMIDKQYVGQILDMDINYVDSLLPSNIKMVTESSNNELIVMKSSSLVLSHKSLDLSFDLEKIINGDYAKEFNYDSGKNYKETGCFTNGSQLFVDLWAEWFSYDPFRIYETSSLLKITDGNSTLINTPPEFVGSKNRIRLQGYYEIRKQLVDYIRDKIHDEWVTYGKTSAIKDWYINCIQSNLAKIEEIVVSEYLSIQNGGKILDINWRTVDKEKIDIYYEEQKYPSGWGNIILNKRKSLSEDEYFCMQTGAICSLFFTFAPKNWRQLELLCGCEVPKIIKGWIVDGHHGDGNSILNATDLVTQVGTPFERYESNRYENLYNEHHISFDFKFSIGYSKRGIKQILKNNGLK